MTRFKKECKKRGIRFDEDFPCLPYHKNNSSIGIECVNVEGNCEQIGYVITGKTMFDKGDYSGYTYQFIDLWVKIVEIVKVDFS